MPNQNKLNSSYTKLSPIESNLVNNFEINFVIYIYMTVMT